MLHIALPKGRLGDKVYGLFSSIGYDCAAIFEDNRKLVFENPERGVRYLLVKPSDVAIYVEHGAADIGTRAFWGSTWCEALTCVMARLSSAASYRARWSGCSVTRLTPAGV